MLSKIPLETNPAPIPYTNVISQVNSAIKPMFNMLPTTNNTIGATQLTTCFNQPLVTLNHLMSNAEMKTDPAATPARLANNTLM